MVAIQEIETQFDPNFDILKMETGFDGAMCFTEEFNKYGIGILWKPSLGTPVISKYILQTQPSISPLIVAEFANFYFICTHYHDEFTKISESIIDFAKNANKPVYTCWRGFAIRAKSRYS